MNIKYLLGATVSWPLLPIMYVQGKRIRANIPDLPDAQLPYGFVKTKWADAHRLNLLIIGESTMAGVGVETHQEGFAGALAQELSELSKRPVDWSVMAQSGYKAKDVSDQIVSQLGDKRYDVIAVGLGGNDAFTLNTPSRWRRDIRQLIDQLKAKYGDTPIVFTNVPPIKEFPAFSPVIRFVIGNLVNILAEELSKVAKEYDHVYFNQEILKLDNWKAKLGLDVDRSAFFSDGVHPSKLTYQTWGNDFAQFIVNQVKL